MGRVLMAMIVSL